MNWEMFSVEREGPMLAISVVVPEALTKKSESPALILAWSVITANRESSSWVKYLDKGLCFVIVFFCAVAE